MKKEIKDIFVDETALSEWLDRYLTRKPFQIAGVLYTIKSLGRLSDGLGGGYIANIESVYDYPYVRGQDCWQGEKNRLLNISSISASDEPILSIDQKYLNRKGRIAAQQARANQKNQGVCMSFGEAIKALKAGNRLARKGWNGKGIFIALMPGNSFEDCNVHQCMTHDYIYIDTTGLKTKNNSAPLDRVPWLASQTDMLADDWEVVQ